ncbi:MAG: PD-(D/E)XK nuclease family protein [Gammaproteobacteria bacterium]|nr:PD-(D/E)XK nuclease family protein [Gammaproteobacteria bacterium]
MTATVVSIPFDTPPLAALAAQLLARVNSPTELLQHTVVLPEPHAAAALRQQLLQQAVRRQWPALLGPHIYPLEHWLRGFYPNDRPVGSEHDRIIILVEALLQHPQLVGQANVWNLAETLLQLFDELSLNHIPVATDRRGFTQQLARYYGLRRDSLAGLTLEAELIQQLWLAWHTQLHAARLNDTSAARVFAYSTSPTALSAQTTLHLVGIHASSRAEQRWLQAMLQRSNVVLWVHGHPYPSAPTNMINQALQAWSEPVGLALPEPPAISPYQHTLANIFDPQQTTLALRAQQHKNHFPTSPIQPRLQTFCAQDAEQEARAIDLQVRLWLLEGKRRIAIVTENRRLARRVRALLERADIPLHDSAGWALSTTRAAAALEALLQCIEEDFAHLPLLDLFKSSFIFSDRIDAEVKNAAYRLERDIIAHDNISRGLRRYRHYIRDRSERLKHLWPEQPSLLDDLLAQLETSTQPLLTLLKGQYPAATYFQRLSAGMQQLGMSPALQADAAGQQLLQLIDTLHQVATQHSINIHWLDFRAWLGRQLESVYFRPADNGGPVQLFTLAQAQLQDFDALILAGAEQEYLAGHSHAAPFFNATVRRELGLRTPQQVQQTDLLQFYRVLHSAPQLLISYRREQHGESIVKSPWVEAIESFHCIAYGSDLQHPGLALWLLQPHHAVMRCDSPLLAPQQMAPLPRVPEKLIPKSISYSDFQQLVNCPYQFFAARCLGLSPPEEVRLALSKREYGERVHQCLQAFHTRVEPLPGPVGEHLTPANRNRAIRLLQQISEQVFAQDLRDNFTHRGWYYRWLGCIPAYVDWQIEREQQWRVDAIELKLQSQFNPAITLRGRIDRIDAQANALAIIDYKSGTPPSKREVLAGEEIQLPFYALLLSATTALTQGEYLKLDTTVKSESLLDAAALSKLAQQLATQITASFEAMQHGSPLPAHPNEPTCRYCTMEALCRRQYWETDPTAE